LSLALLFACPALAYTGEKLAKDAKVSIAAARAIALKAHHIKSGSSTQEVGVDARTGRILENAKEGKNPD
jgi:hypothetical protein